MDHIQGLSRKQMTLFPQALDDYISQENPVRFIDAYVGSLHLERLGFRHAVLQKTGRPPYHPSDLLKLYLYGYLNRVRSSRQLEREAQRNVEVMWLVIERWWAKPRRGLCATVLRIMWRLLFGSPDTLFGLAPHQSLTVGR